jgi:hypothetical protein
MKKTRSGALLILLSRSTIFALALAARESVNGKHREQVCAYDVTNLLYVFECVSAIHCE